MCRKLFLLISLALALGLVSTNVAVAGRANLIGWWTFDEGAGTIASDSSGQGNDGALGGNPQWVAGIFGGALELDGDDDYVAIDGIADDLTDNDFTVSAWIKTTMTDDGNVIGSNSGGDHIFIFGVDGGNLLVEADSANTYPPAVNDDRWHFIAYVRDGSTAYAYTDGQLAGTETPTGDPSAETRWSIGQEWDSSDSSDPSDEFNGTVDDVRFYDGPLSADHVLGLFNGIDPTFLKAMDPDPADGVTHEDTWVSLGWVSGETAASHDVYMSDNLDDVSGGAAAAFQGNQALPFFTVGFPGFPFPEGLIPGTTYYWRIDEVEADGTTKYRGDVWSFWVPSIEAYAPSPSDGWHYVDPDVTLGWMAGFGAKLNTIYFGDSFDDVDNATVGTPSPTTTFTPGTLELDKTYYWRVDELSPPTTVKGDVWSFTTRPVIAIADESLVGWWTLDEGEGTTAVDWSGHGGHGSFVGEPKWVDGFQGMALEFNGRGQYLDCGDEAGAGVTADFTIAAWVKLAPGNAGHYGGIAGKLTRVGGADYFGFAIVRHSSNVFRLWVSDGDSAGINGIASSDVVYTDTEWHHVTGVREGRANMLYVDGVKQAAMNATDFIPSSDFFHIGRQYGHLDDRYFNGRIDDVRVYNKVLTDAQIAEVMNGNTKLAGSPVPDRDALLDIRDISSLSWSRGDTAGSHDVYLGTDRDAVAGADDNALEFQGNQAGTSLSLAALAEFGGGDYYWRIDEVEAGGTVHAGAIWKFTVPDYLIVDNFESYNNIDPPDAGSNRIFDNWIDGFGTTTNGALVGNDLPPYAEQGIVHAGNQSLVYAYDNAGKTSEATLTPAKRDWTAEGVTKLILWFRGNVANAADRMFVALNGTSLVYHDDASATQTTGWNQWLIDVAAFGVDLTNVNTVTIGLGTKNSPATGGAGTMYFDDLRLYRVAP